MSLTETVSILVFDTQSPAAFRGDLASVAYGLHVTTVHPGGCEDASFKIQEAFNGELLIPPYVGFNYELQLWDSQGCYWIGRIEDFEYNIEGATIEWSIVAKGYGVNLDDNLYTSQNVSGKQTSVVVSDALTALATQIGATSITATGFTLSGATAITLKMLKATQVVNWARRAGDSSDNPQLWYVFPDNDTTVRFTFKPRPTTADVLVKLGYFEQNRGGLVGRRLYNSVALQYNSGASTVTSDDTTLQGAGPNGWNLKKVLVLYQNELTQSVDAQQVADVALGFAKIAKIAARDLTLKKGAVVLDSNRIELALTRVRAGMLLRFEDIYAAQESVSNVSLADSALIAATAWDEESATLNITLESLDQLLDAIIARSQQTLEGRISL